MTAPAALSKAAALGVAWALAYLPIHLYWALTGGVWPMEELPDALEAAQWKQANWGASVIIVGAALVCLALAGGTSSCSNRGFSAWESC